MASLIHINNDRGGCPVNLLKIKSLGRFKYGISCY